MITCITAHASSHHLTHNINKTTNRYSTKANDKDNGGIPEASLRRRNNHQEIWRKTKGATRPGPIVSSATATILDKAKASHLANDSRHRVLSKGIALYVARLATVLLIVCSVADSKLCFRSHNNPPRLTTLSWETECWAIHHWL